MIHALTRPPEEVLAATFAVRPLYADLRPAFAALDPLLTLLRRRGFTGLMHVSSEASVGTVWFDRGRPERGWVQAPGTASRISHSGDAADLLRELWSDPDASVNIHPGAGIAPPPMVAPGETALTETAPSPAATPPPPSPPAVVPATPVQAPRGTGAADVKDRPADPIRERRPPERPARAERPAEPPAERPEPPARAAETSVDVADLTRQVPWERLLGAAVQRVRHHRGVRLARQIEELINEILSPTAIVVREEVQGSVDPPKGYIALRVIVGRLEGVAGSAFTHRVLQHVARALSCEEAVTSLLGLEHNL